VLLFTCTQPQPQCVFSHANCICGRIKRRAYGSKIGRQNFVCTSRQKRSLNDHDRETKVKSTNTAAHCLLHTSVSVRTETLLLEFHSYGEHMGPPLSCHKLPEPVKYTSGPRGSRFMPTPARRLHASCAKSATGRTACHLLVPPPRLVEPDVPAPSGFQERNDAICIGHFLKQMQKRFAAAPPLRLRAGPRRT
jgi:hypothetical protein